MKTLTDLNMLKRWRWWQWWWWQKY